MKLLEIDKDGFVINTGSRKKVQPEFSQLVQSLQELCVTTFGQYLVSLYIRGSVSVGKAYVGTSDLDAIVLLDHTPTEDDKKNSGRIASTLEESHPEVTIVDLTTTSVDKLLYDPEWKNLRVNIKTQSALLYGKDTVQHLTGIRPGRELALMMFGDVMNELEELHSVFKLRDNERTYQGEKRSLQFWCVWACRVILRSSMGIVMTDTPLFSPDLTTCKEIFSMKYPEFSRDMEKVLAWAFNPPTDSEEISSFLDTFLPKYAELWNKLKDGREYEK